MIIEVKIQVKSIGKVETFGKNSTQKREIIGTEIEEKESKYPNVLKFSLVKENVKKIDPFKVGDVVEVSAFVNGREWEGRVFIELVAFRIQSVASASDSGEVNESNTQQRSGDDPLPF